MNSIKKIIYLLSQTLFNIFFNIFKVENLNDNIYENNLNDIIYGNNLNDIIYDNNINDLIYKENTK